MAPLLLELSQLEVESLEVVANQVPLDRSLEALTMIEGEVGAALLVPDASSTDRHHHHHHCCDNGNCGCTGSYCERSG